MNKKKIIMIVAILIVLIIGVGFCVWNINIIDRYIAPVVPVAGDEFVGLTQEDKNKLLFKYSAQGDLSKVQKLIQVGADVNTTDSINYNTPIIAAGKNIEVIKELIKNGANLEAENQDRQTALSLACENKDIPTIKSLIGLGADVNVGLGTDAMTMLMSASMRGGMSKWLKS